MNWTLVPHNSGLGVNDIINFARAKIDIHNYVLEFKNPDKLPDRVWIWNLDELCSYLIIFEHFVG